MARLKAPTSIGGIDINPTGAIVGQVLVYDGSKFAPGDVAFEGAGSPHLITPTEPLSKLDGMLWTNPDENLDDEFIAAKDLGFVHVQGVVASTWIIDHQLGFYPNVAVIDSSGAQVEGDIAYVDLDTLNIVFSAPFIGTAYLS